MKKIYLLGALMYGAFAFAQTTLTQWTFNDPNGTNAGTTAPSIGAGSLALVGGVSANFALGNTIANPAPTNESGYNLSTFPAQGTGSSTAGLEATLSTAGYEGITISVDRRGSNTSSRWEEVFFSIDNGATWTSVGNNGGQTINPAAGTLWPTFNYSLPATANNVGNLKVRFVSIFAPSTSAYVAVGATSTYATSGTTRFDNLTFKYNKTLATEKFDTISGLRVSPNPATTELNIASDSFVAKTVEMYDVLGKLALKATVTNQALNVSGLAKGVYVVKITEEGKVATRKVVIE